MHSCGRNGQSCPVLSDESEYPCTKDRMRLGGHVTNSSQHASAVSISQFGIRWVLYGAKINSPSQKEVDTDTDAKNIRLIYSPHGNSSSGQGTRACNDSDGRATIPGSTNIPQASGCFI